MDCCFAERGISREMGAHLPCMLCCNTTPIIRHIGRRNACLILKREGSNSTLLIHRAAYFEWVQ